MRKHEIVENVRETHNFLFNDNCFFNEIIGGIKVIILTLMLSRRLQKAAAAAEKREQWTIDDDDDTIFPKTLLPPLPHSRLYSRQF